MADARLLWRKISECEQLARCSIGANLLFDRILPHTDDDGRFYADPKIINKLIFTARNDITDEQIIGWLKELKKVKVLQLYQVNEARFLRYIKFHEHQPLRKDLRPKILFPEPPKRAVTEKGKSVTGRNEPKQVVKSTLEPVTRIRSRIRNEIELEPEPKGERKNHPLREETQKPSLKKGQVQMHDPIKWKEEQKRKAKESKS